MIAGEIETDFVRRRQQWPRLTDKSGHEHAERRHVDVARHTPSSTDNKQPNKQLIKESNKQTNRQTNSQTRIHSTTIRFKNVHVQILKYTYYLLNGHKIRNSQNNLRSIQRSFRKTN